MLLPTANQPNQALLILECGMTAMATALAFAFPRLGGKWFRRMERLFARLAQRQGLVVACVGLSVIMLRLAILPLFPVPLPFVPDDFSFLLACDTFAHGHLANPTPAMWTHPESIHITMQPRYQSMYFPGQGLLLAASKVVLGNPWIGLLIVSALMCAALCWMLQAWQGCASLPTRCILHRANFRPATGTLPGLVRDTLERSGRRWRPGWIISRGNNW